MSALMDLVVAAVAAANQSDGISMGELASALGVDTKLLTRPLYLAAANGKVRKEGTKHYTRYFAAQA